MPSDYMPNWTPLRKLRDDELNPKQAEIHKQFGLDPPDETWWSPSYQVVVRYMKANEPDVPEGRVGMLHLSIHRHDRGPMRNWRHLQQIKNEVAGELRWAVEVFPPENYLVDSANEYHLFVMPDNADVPFAMHEGIVSTDDQVEEYSANPNHKGKQEPWEPGLTTGRNEHTPGEDDRINQLGRDRR